MMKLRSLLAAALLLFATDAIAQVQPGTSSSLKGYISGLTLANDAVTPNTVLDIASGVATSDDVSATLMKLTSALVKKTGTYNTGTVTITNASPGVFTFNAHGFVAGTIVTLSTTGTLPTGLSPATAYCVLAAGLTANNFEVSTTCGGAAVNTSSAGSGTHTVYGLTTAAWTVGTGNGLIDTGSFVPGSWYHVFEIGRLDTRVVDVVASLSPTVPTLPANYTRQRRIGSIKITATMTVSLFIQSGNEFLWSVPTSDVVTSNPGTSAILATLNVPTGVQVRAIVDFLARNDTTTVRNCVLITSPDQADTAANAGTASTICAGSSTSALQFYAQNHVEIRTNTSGQFRYRFDSSSAGTAFFATTQGWVDRL